MLLIALAACVALVQPQNASPGQPEEPAYVQWAEPPGAATPEETALLDRAKGALESGKTTSDVLTDPVFMRLHPRTEFRELVAAHAAEGPLTIAAPDEPGPRLNITLTFRDGAGEPVVGGMVYLYHTSAKGWYAAEGAHVRANSGDIRHARLFGYGLTNEKGQLEVRTIRPQGYPRSELPAHIHLHLSVGGRSVPGIGEIHFDDDPRLTAAVRERGERSVIVKTEPQEDGSLRAEAVFQVDLPKP